MKKKKNWTPRPERGQTRLYGQSEDGSGPPTGTHEGRDGLWVWLELAGGPSSSCPAGLRRYRLEGPGKETPRDDPKDTDSPLLPGPPWCRSRPPVSGPKGPRSLGETGAVRSTPTAPAVPGIPRTPLRPLPHRFRASRILSLGVRPLAQPGEAPCPDLVGWRPDHKRKETICVCGRMDRAKAEKMGVSGPGRAFGVQNPSLPNLTPLSQHETPPSGVEGYIYGPPPGLGGLVTLNPRVEGDQGPGSRPAPPLPWVSRRLVRGPLLSARLDVDVVQPPSVEAGPHLETRRTLWVETQGRSLDSR